MNDDWYPSGTAGPSWRRGYTASAVKGVSFTQMYLSGGPDLMDRGNKIPGSGQR